VIKPFQLKWKRVILRLFIINLGRGEMIALLGASALTLVALQASITAPTNALRSCLDGATGKATAEKVSADAIDTYLRTACTAQMDGLKAALIAFSMKNGTSRKAAAADAKMTLDDYIATPADNYRYEVKRNASAAEPAKATPAATQASAPANPQAPQP
jgi:hypothetical protein